MQRILVVEDEDKLRRALQRGLAEGGYEVVAVEDGDAGFERATAEPFDCVILDVMLPGRDGLQVLGELRAAGIATPVLVLTARGAIEDRVLGLDTGADDYLSKPFAWDELRARVRACVRRGAAEGEVLLRVGGIRLDCVRRRLTGGSRQVELTIRECELLEFLMRRAGRVVGRDELAREVWRDPSAGLTNVIDVYVNYLRKKLDKAGSPGLIGTVRGLGYVLRG